MAITTLPTFWLPPGHDPEATSGGQWGFTAITLNAANDKAAFIFQCPKAGDLHSFELQIGTVSNNPDNGIRLSFQTVDVTTGLPDGTQDQYRDITAALSANTWHTPPGPLTSDGTDLGTKRTVAKGDWIACVVEFVSFVASDAFQVQCLGGTSGWNFDLGTYVGDASTGTYNKAFATRPNLALKYDDGSYAEIGWPFGPYNSIGTYTFDSADTPDEYGIRFQVPVNMRVSGVWAHAALGAAAELLLCDASGTTLRTATIDPDLARSTAGLYRFLFSSTYELSANTTYHLMLKPTTTTTVTLSYTGVSANAYWEAVQPGIEWYQASRTDGGALSTTTTLRPIMGLLIDGVDTGGGAGGGSRGYGFVG